MRHAVVDLGGALCQAEVADRLRHDVAHPACAGLRLEKGVLEHGLDAAAQRLQVARPDRRSMRSPAR